MQGAGWFGDPSTRHYWRFFDGWYWTGWVSDGITVLFDPVGSNAPPAVHAPVPAAPHAQPWWPTFNGAAAGWAVLALFCTLLFSSIVGFAFYFADVPDIVAVFLCYAVLFLALYLFCSFCSTRWGARDLNGDFGFTWRPHDIGWGLLGWFTAAFASGVIAAFTELIPGVTESARDYADNLDASPLVPLLVWAAFGVFVAPLVEELFFRGLLLRSFSAHMHVAWAITAQAFLFGCYHLSIGLGLFNLSYFVSTAVFGFIMGWIAAWRRSLGVTITAHVVTNLAIFTVMIVTH